MMTVSVHTQRTSPPQPQEHARRLGCSSVPARAAWSLYAVLCLWQAASRAAEETPQNFAVHAQFTYVEQETSAFNAPYSGRNSLTPDRGAETVDATLFVGARIGSGAELWISPEIDQGFGLDDTLGVAGFPSGEAYKIGKDRPYVRLPRLFVRETVDLGERREVLEPAQMQLGGATSPDRLVFTVGKFGVPDIFDNNAYAHDARNDFLNWAAIDAGTFDYAADSWGYTVGAALEWYHARWALRFGIFDLSDVPNSPDLEPEFHEFQLVAEAQRDFSIGERAGKIRVTGFDSRGRMGLLDQAVALAQSADTAVDIASVRGYRTRLGASLSLEQELATSVGLFVRAGKDAGNVEPYEFTDIDRTVSAGFSLAGGRWGRADDTVGLAGIFDGISAERERYLNAGGLGILVGDGKLPHPGPEKILETYYSLALLRYAHITFDYQFIANPAYNQDRGPVSVFAVRVHAQY
jgi:high affinity Mn2+ porin